MEVSQLSSGLMNNSTFYGSILISGKKPSVLASFLNAVTEEDGSTGGEDHYSLKDVLDSIQKNETKCQ